MNDSSARHDNSFQLIRFLLATLVVFSHAFSMVRSKDPFEALTGAQLGAVAVNGFFLLSGYLVTAGYRSDPSPRRYLGKRVRRIYPGFVAAWAISIFVVGPIASSGPYFAEQDWPKLLLGGLTLNVPTRMVGVFAGLPFPFLNGSLWTIRYEFACYLLVLALGSLGILGRRSLVAGLAVATTVVYSTLSQFCSLEIGLGPVGLLAPLPRFTTYFLAGAAFQVNRDWLRQKPALLVIALGVCLTSLRFPTLSQVLCPWLGGLALLGLGSRRSRVGHWFDSIPDVSYGTYLYAWPIENLIITYLSSNPWVVFGISIVLSVACGHASWFLVEKPWVRPTEGRAKMGRAVGLAHPRATLPGSRLGSSNRVGERRR